MLKVIANPDDINQVKEFRNIIDVVNPVLNPLSPNLTVQQFINHLTVLYSRENILEHPELFFRFRNDGSDDFYTAVQKIIAPIPDDKLWLFHYIHILKIKDDNKIAYQTISWSDCYMHHTGFYYYPGGGYTHSCGYSYRGDNWPNEIQSIFDAHYVNKIKPWSEPHANRVMSNQIAANPVFNSCLAHTYFLYILNQPYCHNGEIYIRAADVRRFLESDPNTQFFNMTPSDRGFTFNPAVKIMISRHNKTALYRQLPYSASPTALLQWPLVAKGEHAPVCYGVELELASDYTVQNLVDATDEPFFIVKQDSSVTGDKRFKYELATIPMSFKAHKKQWAYWFSRLDYEKFDVSKNTNNGMHVHIGRDSFADAAHVKSFVWFFTQPAHTEFMKFFSHRDQQSFNSYTPLPDHGRSSRVLTFRRNEDYVKQLRGCVHFSSKKTLEVRLFRGIVSLADIIKNLEFVDAIFHFTMQGQNFTQMSLKNFITWLHSQPKNKYVVLKKFLERTDKLRKLIEAADVMNLIFNEKQPKKIIDILEKAKVAITNDHVTILNQRWKKRIFILKDGKLVMNPENNGSLSFLDRLLESKILHNVKKEAMIVPDDPTRSRPPPPHEDPLLGLQYVRLAEGSQTFSSPVFDDVYITDTDDD